MRPARVGFLLLLAASAALLAIEGTAAGVQWNSPAAWKLQASRPMRVATYDIPAAPGSEPGECGVL